MLFVFSLAGLHRSLEHDVFLYCSYIGNLDPKVTEQLLLEIFSAIGPVQGCKLIKDKVSIDVCLLLHARLNFSNCHMLA